MGLGERVGHAGWAIAHTTVEKPLIQMTRRKVDELMKTVEIIVNKNWETEPFLSALTNLKIRPAVLPFPVIINTPKDGNYKSSDVRARIEMHNTTVIVRCIEDLMDPNKNPSSSEEKYRVLPGYLNEDKPDLVVSVSTAESTPDVQPSGQSENGSVFVGGAFYMYDARSFDPSSESNLKITKEYWPNFLVDAIFSLFNKTSTTAVAKFLAPRNSPGTPMKCVASPKYVCIGVVNVTDYTVYAKADPAAYKAYKSKSYPSIPASIETTHGIVKMSAGSIPTLFVSPITDRYEKFDVDVTDTQNYATAFNAGVVVGEWLVALDKYFGDLGENTSGISTQE